MGDYGRYILVKNAYDHAKKYKLKIEWRSNVIDEGWTIESRIGIVRGVTAEELHQYLNGIDDGLAMARN